MRASETGRRRRIAVLASAALAAGGLSSCKSMIEPTGSVGPTASIQQRAADEAGGRGEAERWAAAYDANPGEKVASINYARALRGAGRYSEAVAIMRVAAIKAPKDYEVLGAYGKALADDGDLEQAKDVLAKAYPLERPDWTILSVQGVVEDKLGNFSEAQRFYSEALKIAPGDPSVLTNLGLSYALQQRLPLAEQTLRAACASPGADARTRENLALVLTLEGKYGEAVALNSQDMSADQAHANVRAIQAMVADGDARKLLAPGQATSSRSRPVVAQPGSGSQG